MAELNEKQAAALEVLRTSFAEKDGHGMPLDDKTLLRYLRAR
jgi:hypothetical protein